MRWHGITQNSCQHCSLAGDSPGGDRTRSLVPFSRAGLRCGTPGSVALVPGIHFLLWWRIPLFMQIQLLSPKKQLQKKNWNGTWSAASMHCAGTMD
jgi:hypothetical protein